MGPFRRGVTASSTFAAMLAVVLVAAGCSPAAENGPAVPSPGATAPSPAMSGTTEPSPQGQPSPQGEPTPGDEAAPPPATGSDAPTGTTITTAATAFGTVLVDAAGQAIYIWEVETSDVARCYDGCAAAWPPVLTAAAPRASGDVSAGLLGTTPRSDGTTQVTYGGHPLYYYAHEAPGEVLCHDVATHGGLWWVVQPDGNRAP